MANSASLVLPVPISPALNYTSAYLGGMSFEGICPTAGRVALATVEKTHELLFGVWCCV